MTGRRVVVFGPAYLDRVLRVDRPLVAGVRAPPWIRASRASWKFGDDGGLAVVDPGDIASTSTLPPDWPGPRGRGPAAGRRSAAD